MLAVAVERLPAREVLMNVENTKRLFEDFPELFRGKTLPITQNLMPFGFECDDGWFNLIYKLASDITAYAHEAMLHPIAVQVKEKYGGLRFYVHEGDRHIDDLCDTAEANSYRICEVCGKLGELAEDRGWFMTRCFEHWPWATESDAPT